MQVKLKPWGNSQGIRFTREFLRQAGISPDDVLNVEWSEGKIILSKEFRHRTLREREAEYGGELHLSEELPREAPVGNEVW